MGGKVGAYYNYCAATAGTYCSNSGAGSGDASRDICPRGWRLPSISEYQNLRNAYGNDATFISSLSAITSGEFQGTAAFQQNKGGYYWTSSYVDGSNMRRLRITKSGVVDFSSSQNRSEGISIRCVKAGNSYDETWLNNYNNKISGSVKFSNINGRDYKKTNDQGALLGFVCHKWPNNALEHGGRSYIGPVLVSKSPDAVSYTVTLNGEDHIFNYTNSFQANGQTYYYGSWEYWMEVNSCSGAESGISGISVPLKFYSLDTPLEAKAAVRAAAQRLVQETK